jgi:hypothetical protein
MANMGYCRFENTKADLQDCMDKLEEIGFDYRQLSKSEAAAAEFLVQMCRDIAALETQALG